MADLSSAAFSATTAVALAPEERRSWFLVLDDLDPDLTWDLVPAALTAAATAAGIGAGTVEEFLRVLANDPDPVATLAELRAAGPAALEAAHLAAAGADQAGDGAGDGTVDESAWLEFLHTHGVRWDRREDTWATFREWFRYEAGQRGLGAPALAFVEYAESRDKAQTFDEYQVPHPAPEATPDVSSFPAVREGDSGEWVAYADALLTRAGY